MDGVIGSDIPLNMMPGAGRKSLTGDSRVDPKAMKLIPNIPDASGDVALAADHVVVTGQKLEGVILQGLRGRARVAVNLNIKVPQKIGDVVVGAEFQPPQGISPDSRVIKLRTGP